MSFKQIMATLTVFAAVASRADAAVIRSSQDFDLAGDFATGLYDDNYLPTFDSSLGTLTAVRVHLDGVMGWDDPLIAVTEWPGPGTYEQSLRHSYSATAVAGKLMDQLSSASSPMN